MAGISDLFAGLPGPSGASVPFLGSPELCLASPMNQFRSLIIEHVSSVRLKGPGISRRLVSTVAEKALALALCQRRPFTRKPDAGSLRMEIPATLLETEMLDKLSELRYELRGTMMARSDRNVVRSRYGGRFNEREGVGRSLEIALGGANA